MQLTLPDLHDKLEERYVRIISKLIQSAIDHDVDISKLWDMVPRYQQEHQQENEQQQLFGLPEVAPAPLRGHDWRKVWARDNETGRPYQYDSHGRRWDWREPVTLRGGPDFHLWVVQAMPIKVCKASDCPKSHPAEGCTHYHCYRCHGIINYGELHGGSEIHACVDCLLSRPYGQQIYPDYSY